MDDINSHSTIDTSRPFRSVKEAVAIFAEKLSFREQLDATILPKSFTFPKQETPFYSPPQEIDNNEDIFVDALKKLEEELEETKMELKLLKEKECETEVALASLNAELHENMSKLAIAEAKAEGGKERTRYGEIEEVGIIKKIGKNSSATLAEILCINGEKYEEWRKMEKKVMKKKPIIPLVLGNLFSRKKGSSSNTSLHNPLFGYSLNI